MSDREWQRWGTADVPRPLILAAIALVATLSASVVPTADADRGDYPALGGDDTTAAAPIAGEWLSRFAVAPGETVDVVLDVGRFASRWAGEFDVLAFGAEDYPVEVTYDPPNVSLQFSAIEADFQGTFAPGEDVIRGIAKTAEAEHLLVFRRVGAARFSKMFLELEAAAEDTARVATLSADASELRERFNAARGRVRLVLLLSPT